MLIVLHVPWWLVWTLVAYTIVAAVAGTFIWVVMFAPVKMCNQRDWIFHYGIRPVYCLIFCLGWGPLAVQALLTTTRSRLRRSAVV